MNRKSGRVSVILAAFAALLIIAMPHDACAATGTLQNPDMSNCRQNWYQGSIKRAQDKAQGLSKIWSNVTPPNVNGSCLTNLMSMFSLVGSITDPFNLIWQLVLAAIQSFIDQICQQVMSAVTGAINLIKGALCIPIPSMKLNFSLSGGSFGGSSSCNGVALLGVSASAQVGPALPPVWQWNSNLQPR